MRHASRNSAAPSLSDVLASVIHFKRLFVNCAPRALINDSLSVSLSLLRLYRASTLFGFLPPIELSLEIESIKRGPVKTLRYYSALFEGLAWQLNRKK